MATDDWRQPRKVGAGDAPAARRLTRGRKPAPPVKAGPASREVVIRVTGRTNSVRALGTQLAYLTRRGDLPGLHSSGRVLHGMEDMKRLRDEWVADNAALARRSGCPSQSVSVVLSMPYGTPPDAVREATLRWAETHISPTTDWVSVVHLDRSHPHSHTACRLVGHDRRRLNIGPPELQAYRETFARELRRLGITAEASPRRETVERLLERQREVELPVVPLPRVERTPVYPPMRMGR